MILVALAALSSILPSAEAARVKIAGATASSSYPEEEGVRYDPKQAFDSKIGTCWVEGEDGSGLGAWLQLDLEAETALSKIKIWPGMWYTASYWERANRPKEIEVKLSDGSSQIWTLEDKMVAQELDLGGKKTKSVKLQIKGIYSGSTWYDTAISDVQLFDATAEEDIRPQSYRASSTAPADNDGNYDPVNVGDGIADTMWCEGGGDGAGESLELDFGSPRSVSRLRLINGIGGSMKVWMKGNRATTATLSFSDGSTEQIALKNVFLPQTITFPAHTTSSVKLTFDDITKGKEFDDLCISEAVFLP